MALVKADRRLLETRGGEAIDGGARPFGQSGGQRRVVEVGVGDQDRGHPLSVQGPLQGVQVSRQIRAGVDHRDLARAHDVGPGAGEGEGARVFGDDPPDQG